ncbi:unnamed protein product [Candida verbasci]|uniref:Inosine/uridine-preferring nucleoside hydrolase domain-containing protein n=1 Tax=Candida verbasci TaxID=1227364 RepID=A0A9W4XA68_9ASCO|nr:unnamed protein product [Candida verbasci]
MTLQSIPVWLDCDPGNDDAFAILLSIFDSRFNLLGISTVHGNAPLDKTTKNALGLLDLLHIYNIPVYNGSELPLAKLPRFATHVHGINGIGGVELPNYTINQHSNNESYLEGIKQAIDDNENEICLCFTGALTNLSKLITTYPKVKDKIKYISIMGGAFGIGNITPFSEFNFHADPKAAKHIIQELQDKIILSPLNLTHEVTASAQVVKEMERNGHDSIIWKAFYEILNFYYRHQTKKLDGPPLHDPVALYSLLPFISHDFKSYGYKYLRRRIDVVETGEKEGQSYIIDIDIPIDKQEEQGVYIGSELDGDLFWASVLGALKAAEMHVNKLELENNK